MPDFGVETIELDLPRLAGAFGARLHDAGVPVGAERAARFAAALTVTAPVSRSRLYWTARAVLVSDPGQVRLFDAVFAEVFGRGSGPAAPSLADVYPAEPEDTAPEAGGRRPPESGVDVESLRGAAPAAAPSGRDPGSERELPVPTLASDEEVLRAKHFDALEPGELARLYRLMARLSLETPLRRTRRTERWRRGDRVDLRRTLRGSLRTGGEPLILARRRRRIERRRLVLLCDISGSMEPYARAYLQFLTCAAGSGARAEAFTFATRLTRLTRALHSQRPERAIARAAATAPDWSGGTRIGGALKTFNDRHGRRGMARGAVVVILSDGWERGDPVQLAREMERLSRLAHRIVWVNPRVAAAGFSPRTGGMAAALPFCDELVSGHSLAALDEVVTAIAADVSGRRDLTSADAPQPAEPEPEAWASATPVAGSSVAMPSGYGPSRGRTTPGWGTGR
ncbi:MAG: VWA domain-containing protein [Solirubrobacteraceae bacterium]